MSNLIAKLSGLIFLVVAIGHLVRYFQGWDLIIGPWTMPLSSSLYAGILLAVLAVLNLMSGRSG